MPSFAPTAARPRVATWAAQGWALQSQAGDSAVLQRDGEQWVSRVLETF